MEEKKNSLLIADFSEIVRKAYEKGINDSEITIDELIEELKVDLKPLVVC